MLLRSIRQAFGGLYFAEMETAGTGGGTGAGAGAGAGAGGTGTPATDRRSRQPAVVFDTQEDFEATLTERVERATRARMRELGITSTDDAKELQRLREVEKERERKLQEEKGNYEKALASAQEEHNRQLQSTQQVVQNLEAEIRKDRIENTIISAATEFKAKNPAHIVKLLQDRVRLNPDTRTPEVLGEDSKVEYKAGKPITVRELVEGFLTQYPNLREPSSTGKGPDNAGGGETADTNAAGNAGDIATLKTAYEEAHKRAIQAPNPANVTASQSAKRRYEEAVRKAKTQS
jgi:hypothetical protein